MVIKTELKSMKSERIVNIILNASKFYQKIYVYIVVRFQRVLFANFF